MSVNPLLFNIQNPYMTFEKDGILYKNNLV